MSQVLPLQVVARSGSKTDDLVDDKSSLCIKPADAGVYHFS